MSFRRAWAWAVLLLVVAGSAALRARLLDVPLDRDEGEYAWMGSLILDGQAPYGRAYHMKMPGTALVYALAFAIFGSTVVAVHLALLVANALSIVLVLLLARRLFDDRVAVASAAIFAIASLNPRMHGLAAYSEHFIVPVALTAALALVAALEAPRAWRFAVAGALFGVAFVVKQSGGLLGLLAIGLIAADVVAGRLAVRVAVRALTSVVLGALVPPALVVLWLAKAGTLETFLFWTLRYASEYALLQSTDAAGRMLASTAVDIVPGAWPVLALALIGLVAIVRGPVAARRRDFVLIFLAASCVAVSVGFYFRHQYFLLLVPAVSLLAGSGALVAAHALAGQRAAVAAATALVALPVLWQLAWQATIFFRATPAAVSRAIYGRNPFAESVEVARYIREHSAPTDRIVVMGSEPQIYFYARRPAATGYIYMYPLMEPQPLAPRMQEDLIREVEAARPKYLVYVHVDLFTSWLATPLSDPTLLRWLAGYLTRYDQVGVAEIVSRNLTRYVWDDAALNDRPKSPYWLGVYRRRD